MQITIDCTPQELADAVLALQHQPNTGVQVATAQMADDALVMSKIREKLEAAIDQVTA